MKESQTIRRSKSNPKTIGSKLADELDQLINQGYSGTFNLTGSMVSGGIGHVDFKIEPIKKNFLHDK